MLRISKSARFKKAAVLVAIVLALLALVYGAVLLSQTFIHKEPAVVSAPAPRPSPTTAGVASNMLIMGDIYWGRYINDWSQASPLKYAYPFQRLDEFERDKYDAWVANMECPLTNNQKVSSKEEDTYLKFDCSPAYLPEATKWFTAVSLANNHTDNQGAAGFAETKQHLDENGMQYFGSYDPEDYDNLCNILSTPAHVTMSDGSVKQGKLPLVWCGYHGVFKIPSASSIAVMSRYSSLFNVVAMPHSGMEYKPSPDEIKTTLYRGLIDGGADVVLGNHAHWVQSTEAYKGKLIVYSMGNFIFDQQGALDVTRSAVINMDVSVDAKAAPDLDKWLALGEKCGAYVDDCLSLAKEEGLTKLPLTYHFAVLGSRDDGKVTHRATDAELTSIKQRMNWNVTIQGLSGYNSGE